MVLTDPAEDCGDEDVVHGAAKGVRDVVDGPDGQVNGVKVAPDSAPAEYRGAGSRRRRQEATEVERVRLDGAQRGDRMDGGTNGGIADVRCGSRTSDHGPGQRWKASRQSTSSHVARDRHWCSCGVAQVAFGGYAQRSGIGCCWVPFEVEQM